MKQLSLFGLRKLTGAIGVLLLCLLVLSDCSSVPDKILPTFPILHAQELLLTTQAFPRSWEMDACGVGCDRFEQVAHSIRTFGRPGIAGSVVQQVFVSQNIETAHAQFVHLRDAEFAAWPPPKRLQGLTEAIRYHSSLADELAIDCGKDKVTACKAFLRYRNYVVQFYFDIDEGANDGLRISDIAPILEDMDAQIGHVFPAIPTPTQ